jgi:hypothetical protein
MPNVDAFALQRGSSRSPEFVLSPRTDKDHTAAGARCRHRLVRSLASGGSLKRTSEQGFSGSWKPLADNHQVGV